MAQNSPQYDENGKLIIEAEPVAPGERIAASTGLPDKRKFNKPAVKQKRHRATKERKAQVEAMAAYGIQHHIIAEIIGVCKQTLYNYYRQELDTAAAKATAAIAGKVYKQAMEGCRVSQRLYLSTQGGWNTKLDIDQRTLVATVDAAPPPDEDYTDPIKAAMHYKQMIKSL